ncbi:MAG: hypothetical protein GX554_02480 [Elusimicrobia bacterium]|nr:hypothetical protein [Elusimicrobiota bacterium]
MIKIELNFAVALYLLISILILLLWIRFEHIKTSKTKNQKHTTLWQCPLCFYVYVDSRSETISRCPKCNTLHKREKK